MNKIGELTEEIVNKYSLEVEDENVYYHSGTLKHIKKRHPEIENPLNIIENVLLKPDYIGQNSNHENSIEYIKKINENYLVAIKIDKKTNKLIVASTYKISQSKILKRLENGSIEKY